MNDYTQTTTDGGEVPMTSEAGELAKLGEVLRAPSVPVADETYNGWVNHATWCAHLWLANDEGLYRGALDVARTSGAQAFSVWATDALREFAVAFYAGQDDAPEFPDDLEIGRVVWGDVHEAFEPDPTPCAYCKDDTGDEDEIYCGADCAVDHAAELRGEVRKLTQHVQLLAVLYRNWSGGHITKAEYVKAMTDAVDFAEQDAGEYSGARDLTRLAAAAQDALEVLVHDELGMRPDDEAQAIEGLKEALGI